MVLTFLVSCLIFSTLQLVTVHSIDLGDGTVQQGDVCHTKEGCGFDYSDAFTSKIINDPKTYLYPDLVHVAVVACGDRQPETVVAVKAILLTATASVFFHIFTEEDLKWRFESEFKSWPVEFQVKLKYQLHPLAFPPDKADQWRKLFKPCATQRLFIPILLRNIDSVLYIDTDVLLMRPVQDVWNHFKKFNSTHLAAVAPEHESASAGWYNRFARHPFYGRLGINSGVMLMNLSRIREFDWVDTMDDYLVKYRYNITFGDQDLLNILFYYHPEMLYVYDCSWNYRPDHCMYMSVCKQAEEEGISVLHGSRSSYHNDKEPAFKAIYEAYAQYKFDGLDKLLAQLENSLSQLKYEEGRCEAVKHIFIKKFKQYV